MPAQRKSKKTASTKKAAPQKVASAAADETAKTTAKKSSSKTKARKPRPPSPTAPDNMTGEVIEFITAIDEYKRKNQRPFPSWSEILDIVKTLGYAQSK